MDVFPEALVVSDNASNNVSCTIYDLNTKTQIATFKGNSCAEKGLAFVKEDYIISAIDKEPSVKVWTLCDKSEDTNMIVPGIISCLAVTDCGAYCIGAIDKFIFVWETSSGELLGKLEYHLGNITCLRFSSNGSHFLSGCTDGTVATWLLSNVVDMTVDTEDVKPIYSWNDHASEVTDIYVGDLGIYAHVATASKDATCQIYELATGIKLVAVYMDFIITALTRDSLQHFLIMGSSEGEIYRINMFSAEDVELHHKKADIRNSFLGHSKRITCLSVSMSGKLLVSGSEDGFCKIWDMTNFSCVKEIACSGAVTNAFATLMPYRLGKEQKFSPQIFISKFRREKDIEKQGMVETNIQDKNLCLFHVGSPDQYFDPRLLLMSPESTKSSHESSATYKEDLVEANSQLFAYALTTTISESAHQKVYEKIDWEDE